MEVKAWQHSGFLVERYQFAPGPITPLPAHAHEAIQLCLNLGSGGSYHYRGARRQFAPGNLTVINSGEAHSPGQQGEFQVPTAFHMLYFQPQQLHALAQELAGRPVAEPYFATLVLGPHPAAKQALLWLAQGLSNVASQLTIETQFLRVQTALLAHHARHPWTPRSVPSNHPAVARARDYLHAHRHTDVSLAQLADAACLSEYHLCRLFAQRYGVPPNQYHIQLRLDQAKRLLLHGTPVGRVAQAVGFFDGSHLRRHFERIVGLSPTGYSRHSSRANSGIE